MFRAWADFGRATRRRPFQGWRYLKPEDAPKDIGKMGQEGLPAEIAVELSKFGLL